jgi:hypothetical protein
MTLLVMKPLPILRLSNSLNQIAGQTLENLHE